MSRETCVLGLAEEEGLDVDVDVDMDLACHEDLRKILGEVVDIVVYGMEAN